VDSGHKKPYKTFPRVLWIQVLEYSVFESSAQLQSPIARIEINVTDQARLAGGEYLFQNQ
jgi:hypothetical protein